MRWDGHTDEMKSVNRAARKARYYRKHKDAIRARKQRVDPEVIALIESCMICGSTDRLCIDHDHDCCPGPRSCGRCVRGVLCAACNKMLGFAKDDPHTLLSAVRYLREGRVDAILGKQ